MYGKSLPGPCVWLRDIEHVLSTEVALGSEIGTPQIMLSL